MLNSNITAVAIDTEFETRFNYWPKLALIQICDGTQVDVIDCVAITDLSALKPLLESPTIKKIFHSGQQDWQALVHHTSSMPAPIMDVQHLHCFFGNEKQVSLAELSCNYLNIELDKKFQRTNWLRRPLTDEQIHYAATDAWCTFHAHQHLFNLLDKQKQGWYLEDMQHWQKHQIWQIAGNTEWQKFCNISFNSSQCMLAFKILQWRLQQAQALDLPKRSILMDDHIDQFLRDSKFSHFKESNFASENLYIEFKTFVHYWRNVATHEPDHTHLHAYKLHIKNFSITQRASVQALEKNIKTIAEQYLLPENLLLTRSSIKAMVQNTALKFPLTNWRTQLLEEASLNNAELEPAVLI